MAAWKMRLHEIHEIHEIQKSFLGALITTSSVRDLCKNTGMSHVVEDGTSLQDFGTEYACCLLCAKKGSDHRICRYCCMTVVFTDYTDAAIHSHVSCIQPVNLLGCCLVSLSASNFLLSDSGCPGALRLTVTISSQNESGMAAGCSPSAKRDAWHDAACPFV